MSESKVLKWLYEAVIQKEVEEKTTEKKEDGTEIIRPVKVLKPIKLGILKPGRKLYESAEIYYAKTIASFIKEGLLPYSLVEKRFINDGGDLLNEKEKDNLQKLQSRLNEYNLKISELLNDNKEENIKEKSEILMKISTLNDEINNIKGVYSNIFENTAEIKARDRIVSWWVLYLSYIEDDKGNYKCLFGDGNLEDKFENYDNFEDKNDNFYNDIIKKFTYLISYWFAIKNNVELKKSDFETVEKIYDNSISTYKTKVTETKVE